LASLVGVDGKAFDKIYWDKRGDYDRGNIDGPAYWRGIAQATGVELSPAQIDNLIAADIAIWMRANPVMMDWVRALKSRGLKIAVLSNMPIEISRHMREHAPWFGDFDYVCFSAEVHLAKPEAPIFYACLKMLRSRPEESLFIDDREENVEGAHALGMRALKFVSVEKLAADIQPFSLPPPLAASDADTPA
jgi:putative hydrolase of the HAD superfamily